MSEASGDMSAESLREVYSALVREDREWIASQLPQRSRARLPKWLSGETSADIPPPKVRCFISEAHLALASPTLREMIRDASLEASDLPPAFAEALPRLFAAAVAAHAPDTRSRSRKRRRRR